MARKKNPETISEEEQENREEIPFDSSEPQGKEASFLPETDFDLEDEYKPEPLVSSGNYRGNVIGVVLDTEKNAIVWKVALAENGGVMSDGETPIDGSHHYYRNWLPKPGDENEPTKSGRGTKRQSKINMLKRFSEEMSINMNTPELIAESITQQDWIGISVMITVSIDEYMGITRNQIDKMVVIKE